jgi:prephenate dehydratase
MTTQPRISIQGYRGSFHHLAATYYWSKDIQLVERSTFAEVYEDVVSGQVEYGLAAIENTIAGSVTESLDQLLKQPVQIIGEIMVRVKQNLIGMPDATVDKLTRVYSHPVALQQCEKFFAAHPHIELIATDDTGKSVERMMQRGDVSVGSVASSLAAELYGAKILEVGIESDPANFTRFFVLTKKTDQNPFPSNPGEYKTSMVIWLQHVVGSLANCLAILANNGCNLVRIESRPVVGKPWEYVMYLDLQSSHDGVEWQELEKKIQEVTSSYKVLGRYLPGQTYSV